MGIAQELNFSLSSEFSSTNQLRIDRKGPFLLDISCGSHRQTLTVSADFERAYWIHTCETASFRNLLDLEICGNQSYLGASAILKVLATAPSLQRIVLEARVIEYSESGAIALHVGTSIKLHHLRCFSLEVARRSQLEGILDRLDVPILEKLKLNSFEDDMPEDGTINSILNMLRRYKPPLKDLEISLCDIGEDDILLLMEASSTVKYLYINSLTCNYSEIFRRLIAASAGDNLAEVLCPRLECLFLRCPDVEECVGEITQMLISRSPPGGRHYSDRGTDESQVERSDEDIQAVHQARYGTSILKTLQLIPHPDWDVDAPEGPATWLIGTRDIGDLCLRGLIIETW